MGADGEVDAVVVADVEKKRQMVVQCKHWADHMMLSFMFLLSYYRGDTRFLN